MSRSQPKWLRKWKREEKKASRNWKQYAHRDRVLKEIGYSSYADYLASDLWKGIRADRLSWQPNCSCCERAADVVHHDCYHKKLLLGDKAACARDLYPLCKRCHYVVEFAGERKRSSAEAVRQLRRMLYRHLNGMSKTEHIRIKRELVEAARSPRPTCRESCRPCLALERQT